MNCLLVLKILKIMARRNRLITGTAITHPPGFAEGLKKIISGKMNPIFSLDIRRYLHPMAIDLCQ